MCLGYDAFFVSRAGFHARRRHGSIMSDINTKNTVSLHPRVRRVGKLRRIYGQQKYLYLLLLPGVVLLFLFDYVPMYGASIAFKDFNPIRGILGSDWVGLKHFEKFVGSTFFWRVLRNTLILNVYHILFAFPAPIVLALLLNEIQNVRFKRAIQTVTYLPHFISWVTVGGFIIALLSPSQGIISVISRLLYDRPARVFPLIEPRYFRAILVTSSIWKEAGWGSIIYLAAIAGIDPQLYDAAVMDGANRFRQTLHVTLPSIVPTIAVLLVLRFGHMLSSNFEQVFVLYSPSVYSVGDVISTFVFREGLGKANFSYTTAVGLFQSVVGFVLIITANRFSRRLGGSLW